MPHKYGREFYDPVEKNKTAGTFRNDGDHRDDRAHLKAQGIDQWQTGYPDRARIAQDLAEEKGYFLTENEEILGYLCIDHPFFYRRITDTDGSP